MHNASLLPLVVLSVCAAAGHAPADDTTPAADAALIHKLVEQLGNDDFNEREKASAALDALGEPALGPLHRALESTDEEVRKRADMLVSAIEKRLETAAALKAKRVHLVYKNLALKDALADFEKQCGYRFALQDFENKLGNRTITLDSGDAPFWQAFDQFCDKAGVKEGEAQEPAPVPGRNQFHFTSSEPILLADGKAGASGDGRCVRRAHSHSGQNGPSRRAANGRHAVHTSAFP